MCALWGLGLSMHSNSHLGISLVAMTHLAACAGALTWMAIEWWSRKKPSVLGMISGAIAGLVAVTPAAGNAGPFGAILLGAVAAVACCVFVMRLKARFGFDDSLDAFGIHGLGGIIGSIGTAVTMLPALGGPGADDYALLPQLVIQVQAVLVAIAWAAVGSAIAFGAVKLVFGLRVSEEQEREGLDLAEHGERAYNY